MVEREHGTARAAGDDDVVRLDNVAPSAAEAKAVTEIADNDDAEFERQMAIGRRGMRKHRNVLAALAK